MNAPGDHQWLRVEQLGAELGGLPPQEAASRIAALAAKGESTIVLSLLGTWLALPAPPPPVDCGSIVGGRYTLRQKLGEGGMGSVWRAKQDIIGRDVALKIIHPSMVTPALQARFMSEIELLGRLEDPGIVRIYDAGMSERPEGVPIPFFVMELVEGLPLDDWAAERRHDRAALLRTAAAICTAMQSAHEQQIIHRDLKPSNIMVRPTGQPVVVDFGIARLTSLALGEEWGVFSGTPQYAAPEQHLGRDHDFRSGESVDVYAIGAILFEILAGRRLFQFPRGASLAEMRAAVLEGPVPRLADVLPDCPRFLDELVTRSVRRDPADRFYSVASLGRAIVRAAELLNPAPVPREPWKPGVGATVPGTQWRLTAKIGEGGAGEIWTGTHDKLGERRVFKFCGTQEKARTLRRELTLFRLLKERVGRNPHFVQLHEVSLDEPPWYLMMDALDAQDLGAWWPGPGGDSVGGGEELALEIIAQTAEALQAAHEAGILHRDIKPANLLIQTVVHSPGVHVLVADFGVGQIVADELLRDGPRSGFTHTVLDLQTNRLSGTLLYLAPEVLEGNHATARSDLYSLGVILWQLLVGNLHAALDPAEWRQRVADPLLREDLGRCLAGSPDKRWSSAGQLAASLRSLPDRRTAAARRQAEFAAREQAAYRRGALRTAGAATALIAVFAVLAGVAWAQRRNARSANGESALNQAMTLSQWDLRAGRRNRGMSFLQTAAATVQDHPRLRTAAARVFGIPDLVQVASHRHSAGAAVFPGPPLVPRETARVLSHDGATIAIASDKDGLSGEVELFNSFGGKHRLTLHRDSFPWLPVPERGLMSFSPNDRFLAVGGAATSRQVLIFNVLDGTLDAYIYQGSDPLACAWHPGGRLFAIGCADGTIRILDIAAAAVASANSPSESQFGLPPKLDAPALDFPISTLQGHRSAVRHMAFSTDGRWLASLDSTGYLRIHEGFSRAGLPRLPDVQKAAGTAAGAEISPPSFAVEVRLEGMQQFTGLAVTNDRVFVSRSDSETEEFRFSPAELRSEVDIRPGTTEVAWNDRGTELCAITPSDIQWLHASPLEAFHTSNGKNPMGVAWVRASGFWGLGADDRFVERRVTEVLGGWKEEDGLTIPLKEAVAEQGARTSLAACGDGRLAIYHGRRIQFFAHTGVAAGMNSITADGGGGVFRQIYWDQTGRALGVVFGLGQGRFRLESWETSTNFPPVCRPLPARSVECDRLTPANDGRHWLVRGHLRGLFYLDPKTGAQTNLDTSESSRQDGPLQVSANGGFLAVISDRNQLRLLTLPAGELFAELASPRLAAITGLAWDSFGRQIACITEDGYLQCWNPAPHGRLGSPHTDWKNEPFQSKKTPLPLRSRLY